MARSWRTPSGAYLVKRLALSQSHAYLIFGHGQTWLVDTGWKWDRYALRRAFKKEGVLTLDGIFLTHVHPDHVANAAFLQKAFACPVHAQAAGWEILLHGQGPLPQGIDWRGKMVRRLWTLPFLRPLQRFEPVSPAMDPESGPVGSEALIFSCPGHSPACQALVLEGVLAFTGDLAIRRGTRLSQSFADLPQARETSLKRLVQAFPSLTCLPGHGAPFRLTQRSVHHD